MTRRLQAQRTAAATLLTLLAAAFVGERLGLLGPSDLNFITETDMVYVILVVGTFIFVGNSGILSLGHMGFAMIGGYAAALLSESPSDKLLLTPGMPHLIANAHLSTSLAVLAGGALAAAFAALISVPLMRLRGITASLATFAVLNVIYEVASNWSSVTGATEGLSGVPLATTATSAYVWAAISIIIALVFTQSRLGLRLRASREDELAARGVGVHAPRERRIAFILSAFVVGIGGAQLALLLSSITPSVYFLDLTFLTIVMLVVGGIQTLSGAVLGAIVVSVVAEILRRAEAGDIFGVIHFGGLSGLRDMGLALVVLLILVIRPGGLMGDWDIGALELAAARRIARWRRPAAPHEEA